MNQLALKDHLELLQEKKEELLDSWMSFETVQGTLEQYIDIDSFRTQYASLVMNYYFDVIDGKQEIGKCPVMDKFLDFFNEKEVPAHEVYIICSHMRVTLTNFAFDHNFASRDSIAQIGAIADENLTGLMKRYENIIIEKTKLADESLYFLEQYKDAIDASSIVSKTDLKGRITFVNDNFCKISGYKREELIGEVHNIVRHSEMSSEDFKVLWSTIQLKKPWSGLVINRAKDGKAYYVNTIIFPILNNNNEIIEYMSIRHDLTELFQLSEEIEETQKEIIYKMGEIGETRSKETGNHVKRVAEYSALLAKYIGMNKDEVKLLVMASPMHDIGKVGIPDAILTKPGKLTQNEWGIMKTHAEIGHNILKASDRPIFKAAAIVSLEHHEWWDGNGYPRGLKGDEIHIYGRITAIADVFDALGTQRVYKEAWPLEKILDYFKEQRSKQFDPELIDILIDNLNQFLEIKNKFSDI